MGATCGSSNTYPCNLGRLECVDGGPECVGEVEPEPDVCNGIDDDCNGETDAADGGPPADPELGQPCDVPPDEPPTNPCQAGTFACMAGRVVCQGSVRAAFDANDVCGEDVNCNGTLAMQPDFENDGANCDTCGGDCSSGAVNATWVCEPEGCVFRACEHGYWDPDGDLECDYACTYIGVETCNNDDDDCDGETDENVVTPSVVDACGVSPLASSTECTTSVTAVCVEGEWECTFPANVCDPDCTSADELCDALDNDCDGRNNEIFPLVGQTCYSDDGMPYPGHGVCRTSATYECTSTTTVTCPAEKASCEPDCDELCDGLDNDCDGLIDEHFNTNSGDSYYVMPEVVQISSSLWIFAYEASRPSASLISAGTGNGYTCASGCGSLPDAPSGVTLDETPACSKSDVLPWQHVTPAEVEQICSGIGGRICTLSEWESACEVASYGCTWGYNPNNSSCQTPMILPPGSKYCNLGAYDFVPGGYDQDGLLETRSSSLANCWADWPSASIFDITGNVREIVKVSTDEYVVMGGAYTSESEDGATCRFDYYPIDATAILYDAGFRCCFDTNPND